MFVYRPTCVYVSYVCVYAHVRMCVCVCVCVCLCVCVCKSIINIRVVWLYLCNRTVANSLLLGEKVNPENYLSTTISFSDIVGFTAMAANSSPLQVFSSTKLFIL